MQSLERKIIKVNGHKVPLLIIKPCQQADRVPVVVWFHGGGYVLGNERLVFLGRAYGLVERFGVTVVSVGYRLAPWHRYPAALEDCYGGLLYVKKNAEKLGVDANQIMIGGESAGGGLTCATAILARDRKEVDVKYMMPLYPMIDHLDTPSSCNNHNKVWNTRRNHFGWNMYLGKEARENVSPYASPARLKDFHGLPNAYTFVCTEEPFYDETVTWFEKLKEAGVDARVDVYPGLYHAFDMLEPRRKESLLAIKRFEENFARVLEEMKRRQEES